MSSVPLICSSSGVATVSAMVFGLAPGNNAVTTTVAGTTSGYSETGSWKAEISPARKIRKEITPAKIGRSMKKRERFIALTPHRIYWTATCVGGGNFLRIDHGLRPHALDAVPR